MKIILQRHGRKALEIPLEAEDIRSVLQQGIADIRDRLYGIPEVYEALSNPRRLNMLLEIVNKGGARFGEIVKLGMNPRLAAFNLMKLKRSGLLEKKDGLYKPTSKALRLLALSMVLDRVLSDEEGGPWKRVKVE